MRDLIAVVRGIAGLAPETPASGEHVLTDADVIANADRAYSEIRSMVDHQVRTAAGLDTKAGALLTVVVAVAAIVGPRVQLDGLDLQVTGTAAFALALLEALFILAALWPRDFSYGANAADLVASLESYSPASVALARAEWLRDAWTRNDAALDAKHDWYSRGLAVMPFLLVAIAFMVLVGALRVDTGT